MRPNPLAPWELRIGHLRVYYDVTTDEPQVVTVRATQRCGIWVDRGAATLRSRGRPWRLQKNAQAAGPPRGPYREGRAAAPLGLSPRTVRSLWAVRLNFATHSIGVKVGNRVRVGDEWWELSQAQEAAESHEDAGNEAGQG